MSVNATDIELVGVSANRQFSSSLGTSVQPGAIGKGGNVTINTQRLAIRDGAQISASTFGTGDAGDLTVTATDVDLVGIAVGDRPLASGLAASVNPGATGNAGTLALNTQRLTIRDGAQISASTAGNGDGGDLTVTANNIEIIGTSVDGEVSSGVVASVNPGATGQGGTLIVNTRNLRIQDGAGISVATFASGDGGNLIVTATDVELMGTGSGLFTSVEEEATGNGGFLNIDTQRLQVQNGAQVLASTFGDGDVGDLTITATDVELTGAGSGLFASVETSARANSGTLTIDTQNLRIQDGADVSTSTFGNGNGGNLTVTATDIELKGTGSVLGASVEPGATGNGGTLTVDTRNLRVQDGAQVSAATSGNGNGGDLTIQATNVELIGITQNSDSQFPTGLFTSATSTSTGQGGRLTVNADNLTVRDRATVDVRSEGIEAAGDLIINAPTILLDNQASLNGETTAGEGNIILNTSDLRLRRNSNITTNATGLATGGNIEINTDNLIAIEDSDISANAEDSFGGQVIINADALFGTQFRPQQTLASDITATSELGPDFSGTVELNTEIDPSSGLVDLSQTVVDPNDLIAQDFCRQRGTSQFVVTGRGGLASSPNDIFTGDRTQVPLVEPVRSSQNRSTSTQRPGTEPNQPRTSAAPRLRSGLNIIPARGWIRDENGDVILVSYDPTKTGVRRQPVQPPQCQP